MIETSQDGSYDIGLALTQLKEFPVDPAEGHKYLIYAPISSESKNLQSQIEKQIVFISNTESNSGLVCTTLEIPNTGNATDKRFGVSNTTSSQPFIPTTNVESIIGVKKAVDLNKESNFSLVGCSSANNCNLFCATF